MEEEVQFLASAHARGISFRDSGAGRVLLVARFGVDGVRYWVVSAYLRTCVRKKAPLVFSMTCWYTDWGGWFMITVPSL